MAKDLSMAEILHAKFDSEVQAAKTDFENLSKFGAGAQAKAIETMIEAVVKRWWIGRMLKAKDNTEDMQERMQNRMNALAGATQAIIRHSGAVDPNAMQMSLLGLSAELNALWGALIESGMFTPESRQDYFDASVGDLCRRVNEQCQKIVVPGSMQRAS